jgi:hypothetical protein
MVIPQAGGGIRFDWRWSGCPFGYGYMVAQSIYKINIQFNIYAIQIVLAKRLDNDRFTLKQCSAYITAISDNVTLKHIQKATDTNF